MTASKLLPSTQLALLQEKILSRTDYTRGEAGRLLSETDEYNLLLQNTQMSNLHARHYVIRSGLLRILEGVHTDAGYAAYKTNTLRRGIYWSEGPDYLLYTKAAFDWYDRMFPQRGWGNLDNAAAAYLNIVAPDGTIPVPEATGRTYPVPAACVSNDKYIVQRWPSGAYLLVDVGAECDPANLHDWLSAGYFAFGQIQTVFDKDLAGDDLPDTSHFVERFVWAHRCPAYTGFSWANVLGDSVLAGLLPKGALLPGWRLKPPRVTVVKGDSSVTVTWKYPWLPKVQRRIYWSEKLVLVADTTGWLGRTNTRSWPV